MTTPETLIIYISFVLFQVIHMHDHSKRIETLKQNPWINISKYALESCRELADKKTESLLISRIIQKVSYFKIQIAI